VNVLIQCHVDENMMFSLWSSDQREGGNIADTDAVNSAGLPEVLLDWVKIGN